MTHRPRGAPLDEPYFAPGDKVCCRCKEPKPLTDFNMLKKAKDGRQYSCRDCNKAYHYLYWDRHMTQIRARVRRQRRENQAFIVDYLLAHPCVDCGQADIVVLDFDHLRDKTKNVSHFISGFSIRRIKEEIAKCEVVCANCHRRRTAQRANTYRHRAAFGE